VRYPKLVGKGKTNDEMVLNIDLAPTFLELAGIPVSAEMQGTSWLPLLTGAKTDWRQSFLAEYFYEQNYVGTPTLVALRTKDAKLIKYSGHDALWQGTRATAFAFRKLYDTRTALTMSAQGVTELATVNVKDFKGLGFRKVRNPFVG
jgi:arylsulfatase A-like enzyme